MGKEQYMEILLDQIRNKKARELVSQEIGAHIDDQMQAFQRDGLKEMEAERKAVREMGDPVETGVSLDRIHKPQVSWSMILLIGIINIVGLLLLSRIVGGDTADIYLLRHQICYAAMGFVVMILICLLDYSWIGKWCGVISMCFLGICVLACFSGIRINGRLSYLHLPFGISISMQMLAYLSVPLFAALLYKYRKRKWEHLLISVLFMAAAIFFLMKGACSLSLFINLVLISAVLVSFAVMKGWYSVKKKFFLGILWGCLIGIPCVLLLLSIRSQIFAAYQTARLQEVFSGSCTIWSDRQLFARTLLTDSQWIGSAFVERLAPADTISWISDYMVLHVMSYYGILAFLALVGLFVLLCWKMFGMSLHQRNQMGMIMGLGCSLVFLVQIVEYLMMNLGMIPPTLAFLPLISYGGSGTIISYMLLGILLSVYRYQNLAKDRSAERIKYRLRIERVQE